MREKIGKINEQIVQLTTCILIKPDMKLCMDNKIINI